FPVFVYRIEGVEIEKRIFLVHGENSVVLEYEVRAMDAGMPCRLELRPLIAFRDYHGTTHCNDSLNRTVTQESGLASVAPYAGLPTLYFGHNASAFEETGNWYYNFEYSVEQERGLDALEDLFNPFLLRFNVHPGSIAAVIASTHARSALDAPRLREQEIRRR